MIIYSIIGYKKAYHEQSVTLIESFLKHVKDAMLVIVTDDIDFYEPYKSERIIPVHMLSQTCQFKANWKHLCLQACQQYVYQGDIIVYLDCDCYFVDDIVEDDFKFIQDGLNAKTQGLHSPSTMDNKAMVDTILGLNPDTSQLYTSFVECAFLIKVDQYFERFVQAWKEICDEIDDKRLNQAGETYHMQIAALRSGLKVNYIKEGTIEPKILRKCEHDSVGLALR